MGRKMGHPQRRLGFKTRPPMGRRSIFHDFSKISRNRGESIGGQGGRFLVARRG